MTGRTESHSEEREPTVKLVGGYGLLLKVHLSVVSAAIPLLMGWAIWLTRQQYADDAFRDSGERFTRSDGYALEAKMRTEYLGWASRVDVRLDDLDKDNAKILQTLEFLKAKMP